MAFYIDNDGVTVREWRVAGPDTIRFLDTNEVIEGDPTRMFATHPKENPHCELKDGVWHYKGRPLVSLEPTP